MSGSSLVRSGRRRRRTKAPAAASTHTPATPPATPRPVVVATRDAAGGAAGGAPTPDTSLVVLLSREAESKVDAIKRSYLRKLTGNIRVKADYLGLLPFPIWVGGEQRAVSLSAFRSIKLDVAV